jgi:hypothetical protein
MKKLATLSLFFFTVLAASSPAATDASGITLAPPKPLQSNYSAAVSVGKSTGALPNVLHFEIVVTARSGAFPPVVEGLLDVFDGKGLILSCDVQTSSRGKTLVYDFDLDSNYLAKSRFSFKTSSAGASGAAASDVVWFYLKDYVAPSGSL